MTNMTDNEDSIAEQQTKEGVARNQKASQGRVFTQNMWIYEKPKLKIKLPPGASFVDEEQSVLHSVTLCNKNLPKRFLGKPGSSRRGHSIFYSERSVSTFMMKKLIVALKIAVWCRCAFEKYISPDLVHFAFCNDTAMIDVKMKL
ncbi:hypothetical protein Tsp_11034 [Trichinella spiralis]|uniref:hypothetical protein n=1 Tax=Trichinella spiralis TaxID=6334 RepID=UPI0001EFB7C5|nr:hypothetical protein Tsp_11034 [Trichinella spiralis]